MEIMGNLPHLSRDLGDVREILTLCCFYGVHSIMSRKARIDAHGALHHIIIRGMERNAIFRDDQDKEKFIERLGNILIETSTKCYAWALLSNRAHN